MLTYSHVVTTGTADNAFLSNLTDLAIVWFGGRLVLVSSNTFQGGIASFATDGSGTPLTRIDSIAFGDKFSYQGNPEISVLALAQGPQLHLGQLGGAADLGIAVAANGDLGSFRTILGGSGPGAAISAIAGRCRHRPGRFGATDSSSSRLVNRTTSRRRRRSSHT